MRLHVLFLSVAVTVACASLPLKENAVKGLQASELALESAQTIERGLCFIAPTTESGGHCSNAMAATVGLTDARHQALASAFSAAFGVEIKAATALKAWKAGDPAPSDVATYRADAQGILLLVQTLAPGSADLVSKAQLAVNEATAVATALGVK